MVIGKNIVVGIQYTLTNDDGEVMDQSQEGEPLTYLHGTSSIIPGLERELEGKSVGDVFKVTIQPTDAYGERIDEMVQEVPRASFPEDVEVKEGMQFNAQSEAGPVTVTVAKVDGETITVDANHPLAGFTLHFEGKIEGAREATKEELEHGHSH